MLKIQSNAETLPAIGERVHTVDGFRCYRFYPDMRGTVTGIITDRWGTHAQVMMDDGSFRTCSRLCSGPRTQIGWHRSQDETVGGEA
jgi:hypothetical protein